MAFQVEFRTSAGCERCKRRAEFHWASPAASPASPAKAACHGGFVARRCWEPSSKCLESHGPGFAVLWFICYICHPMSSYVICPDFWPYRRMTMDGMCLSWGTTACWHQFARWRVRILASASAKGLARSIILQTQTPIYTFWSACIVLPSPIKFTAAYFCWAAFVWLQCKCVAFDSARSAFASSRAHTMQVFAWMSIDAGAAKTACWCQCCRSIMHV